MLCNVPVLISFAGWRGIREIFEPITIRVWRDSSTNAQPCFFSHRLSSLALTLNGNHLWLLCQGLMTPDQAQDSIAGAIDAGMSTSYSSR